jgi:hypothetical protein
MPQSEAVPFPWQTRLDVQQVLLAVDSPAVFVALVGFFEVLFYKIDELENSEVFIATPLQKGVSDMLRSGEISIRAAIDSSRNWIVETTPDFIVLSASPPLLMQLLTTMICQHDVLA